MNALEDLFSRFVLKVENGIDKSFHYLACLILIDTVKDCPL